MSAWKENITQKGGLQKNENVVQHFKELYDIAIKSGRRRIDDFLDH